MIKPTSLDRLDDNDVEEVEAASYPLDPDPAIDRRPRKGTCVETPRAAAVDPEFQASTAVVNQKTDDHMQSPARHAPSLMTGSLIGRNRRDGAASGSALSERSPSGRCVDRSPDQCCGGVDTLTTAAPAAAGAAVGAVGTVDGAGATAVGWDTTVTYVGAGAVVTMGRASVV
jgi:hypothetical protein